MANKEYISDELLAAYLDGNTSKEETMQILEALKEDKELQEVLDKFGREFFWLLISRNYQSNLLI